jgi:hypothetical protein
MLRIARMTGTYGHKWAETLKVSDVVSVPAPAFLKGAPGRRLAPEEVFWSG